jgi:hypothetical protein
MSGTTLTIELPADTTLDQMGQRNVLFGYRNNKQVFRFEAPGNWVWHGEWTGSKTNVYIEFR